ncbi:Alpha-N-acetylglucosaminidase C-terminal [Trinorchestia longiramus]|nr:Alpha-N-acetylglucosaminidase C-terminal [Trinorchestia longiramus]
MIGAVNLSRQSRSLLRHGVACSFSNEVSAKLSEELKCGEQPALSASDVALNNQETFRHDLVDVTREVLQVFGGQVVVQLVVAYNSSSYSRVKRMGTALDTALQDLDDLLVTSPKFLLGRWTGDAAALATNEKIGWPSLLVTDKRTQLCRLPLSGERGPFLGVLAHRAGRPEPLSLLNPNPL